MSDGASKYVFVTGGVVSSIASTVSKLKIA